jgi:hypothetical protein
MSSAIHLVRFHNGVWYGKLVCPDQSFSWMKLFCGDDSVRDERVAWRKLVALHGLARREHLSVRENARAAL